MDHVLWGRGFVGGAEGSGCICFKAASLSLSSGRNAVRTITDSESEELDNQMTF